jgi:alkanesulfonate monooxygenase SsuD/methylene tetrahydromethanopterin reductase-like flavin-dependent oxidoreductase (luciferase family)
MRFGVLTVPNESWDELVARWRDLEDLGFDSIFVADALAHPRDMSERWLDAWICLTTLAQVTERARIGPLVTSIVFRNAAAVANAAVTVHSLSNGRCELALGAGEPGSDHELAQVSAWPPLERRDHFREYVRRVRALLAEDPRQPAIPLTVAAQASGSVRVAAEFADAWNTYGARGLSRQEGRELVRRRSEELDRHCEEIGRATAEVRRSLLVGYGFIREEPFRSEDAFVEMVDAWRAIGMDELVFYWPPERNAPPGVSVDRPLFERIVRDVMPSLR